MMLENVLMKRGVGKNGGLLPSYLSVRASWLQRFKKRKTQMEEKREEERKRGKRRHKVRKKINTA